MHRREGGRRRGEEVVASPPWQTRTPTAVLREGNERRKKKP
jgi:hypothetical protein